MHFEILVEDQSGKKALDILVPKIIGENHTFRVHPYKGIGRISKKVRGTSDPVKRILLAELPRLLSGYGEAFASSEPYQYSVLVICDLDNKCLKEFLTELDAILNSCYPKPVTRFCIAIEEGEAWLLGDIPAIKKAYPRAKDAILQNYKNDSICGTWEVLADAIFPGGSQALSAKGWQATGAEKSAWAEKITPYMDTNLNASNSFMFFRNTIMELVNEL
ncbi:MAG: hypothetical protein WCJ56_04525 [bacterium]